MTEEHHGGIWVDPSALMAQLDALLRQYAETGGVIARFSEVTIVIHEGQVSDLRITNKTRRVTLRRPVGR
jgi:agmatine/peptidylarginine deiminase